MRQVLQGYIAFQQEVVVGRDKQLRAVEPVDRSGGFLSNFNFSLKGLKAGTNADISCNATSEGSIRNEKRTSSVKWPSDSRLSYSIRMVSIAKEVLGKSMAKFSIRIFRSLAIIFRLSFFSSKPECSSSTLIRLMAALTESFWSAFSETLARMLDRRMCCRVELARSAFGRQHIVRYLSAPYQE